MYNVIFFVVCLVAANLAFIYFGGANWVEEQFFAAEPAPVMLDPLLTEVFIFTLEEEVRKKQGLPEGGYVPQMFLDSFPGLAETDFEGVEASVGYYSLNESGRIELELRDATLVHETPGAISRSGMETLLNNIAKRTGIDLQRTGTITDIVRVLTRT